MSDNVGLSTPRGSGTSGYIQRNLAQMRPRDRASPYTTTTSSPLSQSHSHIQRQPDKGLLEHDRKRQVEVKVFELRDKLEEEGKLDQEEIDEQCDALRKKLLAEQEKTAKNGLGPKRNIKMHQVHELADAKIKESERLRQALKISKDYEEGSHWRRQEERMKMAEGGGGDGGGGGGGDGDEKERDRDNDDRKRRRD
ncbi:cwf21 domain-containing protein [Podospora fimiseda]|uniref:Cwf21 domain-containing protein n=1 Tax=Podospora fimiseda TaxID=252190 RepID=A0AAN6YMQ6_9PEZI|nr:cwf21 domain-containing protein [Podospora fimiseda]